VNARNNMRCGCAKMRMEIGETCILL